MMHPDYADHAAQTTSGLAAGKWSEWKHGGNCDKGPPGGRSALGSRRYRMARRSSSAQDEMRAFWNGVRAGKARFPGPGMNHPPRPQAPRRPRPRAGELL